MAHFMLTLRYSPTAIKALVTNPQDRTEAARAAIEAVGGKLHSMFMMFGEDDVLVIYEAPDAIAAASLAMTLGASGVATSGRTTTLLSMTETVQAMEKAKITRSGYRPPSA